SNSSTFTVHAVAVGYSQITAVMAGIGSTASVSVNVAVPAPTCNVFDVPVASASSTASSATSYDVTWALVPNRNEFSIDEAAAAASRDPPPNPTLAPRATSPPPAPPARRYYYRVTAKNTANGCNVLSLPSAAVSVLVKAPPFPPPVVILTRYLAVVGSIVGNL